MKPLVRPSDEHGQDKVQHYWNVRPIKLFKDSVIARGIVSESALQAIDDRVATQINDAVKFAEESPFPDVKETFTDVYVNY